MPEFDVIIKNGTIVDGTKEPPAKNWVSSIRFFGGLRVHDQAGG